MTRLVTLVSLVVLAGCPGPKPEGTGPGGGTGSGTAADAKDDELSYAPLELKGTPHCRSIVGEATHGRRPGRYDAL